METELTDSKYKLVILEDNSQYSYTVKSVEITNALGAVIAVLDEYSIANLDGENYKLFRTKEGNWYDVPEANPTTNKAVLMTLKIAINLQENRG